MHASKPPSRYRTSPKPLVPSGRLEYAILSALWDLNTASAREIHLRVGEPGCLVYTTTAKGLEWFEDRGPRCVLLVYVDDATSRLMQLLFVHSESAFDYFSATRSYLEEHGRPA